MAANVNRRNRIDQELWSPHYFQRLYQRKHLTRDWPTFWLAIAMLIAFITSCLLQSCLAHVALTYPPARKYNLDFLDNSRTKGPCGMPKVRKSGHKGNGSAVKQRKLGYTSLYGARPVWSGNITLPKTVTKDESATYQCLTHILNE
uniref:Uncharacterized protein n=1 Tax=Glossina palpalis gambiensis TaxID=67801 RepID=A0A1B0ARJ0_9MUSC